MRLPFLDADLRFPMAWFAENTLLSDSSTKTENLT